MHLLCFSNAMLGWRNVLSTSHRVAKGTYCQHWEHQESIMLTKNESWREVYGRNQEQKLAMKFKGHVFVFSHYACVNTWTWSTQSLCMGMCILFFACMRWRCVPGQWGHVNKNWQASQKAEQWGMVRLYTWSHSIQELMERNSQLLNGRHRQAGRKKTWQISPSVSPFLLTSNYTLSP